MIRECIFCGSVLVLACCQNDVFVEFFGPVAVGPDSPPPFSDCCLFHALSSYCSISPSANSRFSYRKNPQSTRPPLLSVSATFLALLWNWKQVVSCKDRRSACALIVCVCGLGSSEASALRSELHDMIDTFELILIPCCVQDLAMLKWSVLRHQIWLFYVAVACHVRFLDWVKWNSVWFLFGVFFLFSCNV